MTLPPPRSTRTDALGPYTSLFRSHPPVDRHRRPRPVPQQRERVERAAGCVDDLIAALLAGARGVGDDLRFAAGCRMDQVVCMTSWLRNLHRRAACMGELDAEDRKSTRLNSSH